MTARRAAKPRGKTRSTPPTPDAQARSWHGRLAGDPAEATVSFGQSLSVDCRLYEQDIRGSIAHATMLRDTGLITADELDQILVGLEAIRADIAAGRFDFDPRQEDIHMAIEAALVARIGDAGRKLHTARSRNDQVALDLRLWLRDQTDGNLARIRDLQRALLEQAERHVAVVMPAYTHLQRAQPIELPAYLLAYVEMLQRDADRFADCRKRINVCPLGAGAVAGTTLPIDRRQVARLLGFDGVAANAIDATSERDVAAEFAFCCTITALHLSRWAEDGCLFASQEFGFLVIEDAYCTSSSMMPQKRNPDLLELMRGKSAAVMGQLLGLLGLIKGLPLAYNRDLQEDKRLIFAAADALADSLVVAAQIVRHSRYDAARLASAAAGGFTDATSLAEYLVGKGLPFRRAHQVVGQLVRQAEQTGQSLGDLPLAAMQSVCDLIGPDVKGHLGAANVTQRYRSFGAAGGRPLADQLAAWRKRLSND